jgi:hypothetical protein
MGGYHHRPVTVVGIVFLCENSLSAFLKKHCCSKIQILRKSDLKIRKIKNVLEVPFKN